MLLSKTPSSSIGPANRQASAIKGTNHLERFFAREGFRMARARTFSCSSPWLSRLSGEATINPQLTVNPGRSRCKTGHLIVRHLPTRGMPSASRETALPSCRGSTPEVCGAYAACRACALAQPRGGLRFPLQSRSGVRHAATTTFSDPPERGRPNRYRKHATHARNGGVRLSRHQSLGSDRLRLRQHSYIPYQCRSTNHDGNVSSHHQRRGQEGGLICGS